MRWPDDHGEVYKFSWWQRFKHRLGFHQPLVYDYHLVGKGGKAKCMQCGRVGLVDSTGALFSSEED